VREALKHAAALAADGKRTAAEAMWSSIENLYRDNPAILEEVKTARAKK
jgi:hypothetical protein